MNFETKKLIHFGYKDKIFVSHRIYTAISKVGNFVDEEGNMGPVDCGSVSSNKNLSLIKAFSESLERRAITLGAKNLYMVKGERLTDSFDLITKKKVKIPNKYMTYNNEFPIVDTTGTAAHIISKEASFNAVSELLEKNAVFLFWYGGFGKKIPIQGKSVFIDYYMKVNFTINLFLVEYFNPLKIIIAIMQTNDLSRPIQYHFGVGSDLNIDEAIDKALAEAYMLGGYYDYLFLKRSYIENREHNNYDSHVIKLQQDSSVIEHLNNLIQYKDSLPDFTFADNQEDRLNLLIKNFPKWITDLYLTVLPQGVNKNIIVAKVFSTCLFSSVPIKQNLNLDININKNTLQITQEQLSKLPDCPIV